MIHQTYTARKPPKTPLAATKWARPLLLHAVCCKRIPFVRKQGVSAALSAFLSPATLTFELWRDFCTMQLTAKFHHPTFNRSEVIMLTNKQTNKLAGWFFRPDCAPSSDRPQFRMPPTFDRCTPQRCRFNQYMYIPPTVVLLQQCHCRNRHRGKLQNLSPPSVLVESSGIFL